MSGSLDTAKTQFQALQSAFQMFQSSFNNQLTQLGLTIMNAAAASSPTMVTMSATPSLSPSSISFSGPTASAPRPSGAFASAPISSTMMSSGAATGKLPIVLTPAPKTPGPLPVPAPPTPPILSENRSPEAKTQEKAYYDNLNNLKNLYTAKQLRDRGYTAQILGRAGFKPGDLRCAGYSINEVLSGTSLAGLMLAGYNDAEIIQVNPRFYTQTLLNSIKQQRLPDQPGTYGQYSSQQPMCPAAGGGRKQTRKSRRSKRSNKSRKA